MLFAIVSFGGAIPLIGQALEETGIVGNWKFKSVANEDALEDKEKKMVYMMFESFTLNLTQDGRYTSELMKQEKGTYEYDAQTKMLTLTNSANERKQSLSAETKADGNLYLTFKEDMVLILSKK